MPVIQRQTIKGHKLAPLKGSTIPRIWLFLDTETEETIKENITYHHFHVGWCCLWRRKSDKYADSKEWTWFLSSGGLNGYIQEMGLRYKRIHVVGHNIFFDLQAAGTFAFLTTQGWTLEFYYDQGLTYILKCKRSGCEMILVSSTNWFDQSLKSLGKVLGLEKMEVDFKNVTADKLKEYCKRDVEILVRLFQYYIVFIQDHDFGNMALTKASQAFTAYRHRFTDGSIFIHSEQKTHTLERAAYMGGRTECYFIGQCSDGPFVSLDINSMYPYVMQKFTYPCKLLRTAQSPTIKFIKEVIQSYGVIAKVTLNTPEAAYGVRYNHKTVFPVGNFVTHLCTEGLKYALERGHVTMVHEVAIYEMKDLFTEYVEYLHKLRRKYQREQNPVMELLSKYMLNALYGKFAQLAIINDKEDISGSEDYSREVIFNLITGHNETITRMMNTQITQRVEGEGKNSNVAIAAHITENARLLIWGIIKPVGTRKVLYCDTDSVKIRKKDAHLITWPRSKFKLGALKVEHTSKELYIEGAKNYRTEQGRRIKGIPESAKEILPGVFSYRWFAGQITHLRKNIPVGVRVEDLTRTLKAEYTKGIIAPDGSVTPFYFLLPDQSARLHPLPF